MVNSAYYLLLTENLYFVTPSIIGCHENYFNSIIAEAGSGRDQANKVDKVNCQKKERLQGQVFVSTSLMGFDTTQLAHVVCSKQYGRYHTSNSGHFLFYFLCLFPITTERKEECLCNMIFLLCFIILKPQCSPIKGDRPYPQVICYNRASCLASQQQKTLLFQEGHYLLK